VAAVAGRVVPHALLAEVTGRGEDELVAAVEAVLAARLLAEDGPDRYRFGHDLIRETVEDGLSAARRRLLHRRIGQALERQGGAAAPTLAFHFAAAGQDAAAAGYLERAGDQAGQQVAWSAAAEFYAAAAARLEAAGRAAAAVPVTEKQGVALYRAGRYAAAITALDQALAAWREAGTPRPPPGSPAGWPRRTTARAAAATSSACWPARPAPGRRRPARPRPAPWPSGKDSCCCCGPRAPTARSRTRAGRWPGPGARPGTRRCRPSAPGSKAAG